MTPTQTDIEKMIKSRINTLRTFIGLMEQNKLAITTFENGRLHSRFQSIINKLHHALTDLQALLQALHKSPPDRHAEIYQHFTDAKNAFFTSEFNKD